MASAVVSPNVDKKTAKPKGSVRRALDPSDDTPTKQPQQAKTFHSNENVIAAASLRVNDQPRFNKIHGLMKNREKEIADEVTRAFRPGAKVKGREWMTANVGNPPEAAGARLTNLELAQICLVSIALTKFGIEKLNQLYDSKQLDYFEDVALHSYELRSNGQAKYRDNSSSQQKENKDVAHYAGLDFVLKVNADLPEQRRVSRTTLQTVLNDPSNFRMVRLETNRGLHKEVDALLLQGHRGDVVQVNSVQRERVVMVVRFFQSHLFQKTMLDNRGQHPYAKTRDVVKSLLEVDANGRQINLWDARRDKRELQTSAVSATNRADGTPNRRFRENKVLTQAELDGPEPIRTAASAVQPPPAPRVTRSVASSAPAARVTRSVASSAPAARVTRSVASSAPAARVTRSVASSAPAARVTRSVASTPPAARVTRPVASAAPASASTKSTPRSRKTQPEKPTPPTASSANGVRLKADGTPDRRFKANRQ